MNMVHSPPGTNEMTPKHDRNQDEMIVISNVLSNSALWDGVRHLRVTDFSPENRTIWRAMTQAAMDAQGINPHSLAAIDPSLSLSSIHAIANTGTGSDSAAYAAAERLITHRRTMQAVTILRQGASKIEASGSSGPGGKEGQEWRTILDKTIAEATSLSGDAKTIGSAELAAKILREINAPPARIATGIQCLDEWLGGGLIGGQMLAMAAESKVGKTVMATTLSHNLDAQTPPVPHLLYSNERSTEEIGRLKVARLAGVKASQLRTVSEDTRRRMANQLSPFDTSFTIYRPGATMAEIEAETKYQVRANGVRLLILDQFQLVAPDETRMMERQHMARAAQSLMRITTDLNIATIVMVQMTDGGGYAHDADAIQRSAHAVLHIRRDISSNGTWIETRASALGSELGIGSVNDPVLWLDDAGPHFRDSTDAERENVFN